MTIRNLLLVAILLLSAPASADVKFMVLGDPQIGRRCSDNSNPWPTYENISVADCRAFQGNMLDALLTYAEDISVDFVWGMGDYLDSATTVSQQGVMRTVVAAHPNLTYHWVVGNHDIRAPYCNYINKYVLNAFVDVTPVRRPMWEAWQVGGVHFVGVSSLLWDTYAHGCYAPDPDYEDTCRDFANTAGTACSSGGATDGAAYGTATTCLSDETCIDSDGYATDQMAAVVAAVTAKEADTGATAIFFGTHQTPWPHDNANVVTMDDGNNAIHNMRQCAGGSNAGYYCNDVTGWDCPGGACTNGVCVGGSADTEVCTRCDGGACATNVAGKDWRSQFEAALAPLSTTAYFLSGHLHDDDNWSGTTVQNSVPYEAYSIVGSAASDIPSTDPLTAMIVTVDSSGTPTFTRILATWQGLGVHGVEMSGVTAP